MADDLTEAAAAVYAAAADHFDDPALSFWDRYGRRTVARAALRPGDRVLDACCGTGASALPAAHGVGPAGHVLGLDLAEPALDRAGRRRPRRDCPTWSSGSPTCRVPACRRPDSTRSSACSGWPRRRGPARKR